MRKFCIGLPTFVLAFLCIFGCKSIEVRKQRGSQTMVGYRTHLDMSGHDILPHCQEHLAAASDLKKKLLHVSEDEPFLTTLNLYNNILVQLDAAMSKASLLSQVHPNEAIRKDAETCEQLVSSFMTDLSLDQQVFLVLKRGENSVLSADAKRMLDHTLRDFRRSGVDKDDATRNRIKEIKAELVTIGQQFGQNIRDDRQVIKLDSPSDLLGLPKDYIESHKPGPDKKIEISTDYPDYLPFMQYAKSDKWRKELSFKYLNRGQKNDAVLQSMMEKRNELARLLNYRSYADYIAEDKMIKNASAIRDFIEKVSQMAKKGADVEYKALLEFKKKNGQKAEVIYGYENAFLQEAFKKEKFNFDSQLVRPYFAYERVRDGLLSVTSQLFGLRYSPVPDAKVWHESVVTYDVYDDHGKLGRIYLDMHPREHKYEHAAQFSVLAGLQGRQYPEGALVCNFPNPKDGPALMEHRDVVTMFHEFGHLLHHLFAGRQEWVPFSGVATEWDFVEAPSQFLEEWAWSPDVLKIFALHYQTNEPISKDLVNRMRAADEFGKALAARQQMFYAALSLDYFDKDPKSFNLMDDLKKIQATYSYFPYQDGTHFPYNFGHLDGYSALYYTYMWSLSLAKDLLEPFKKEGLMNPLLAKRYKELVLMPGGSKDAALLVEDFLGRAFKFDAFSKWLTSDPLTMTTR